MKPAQNIQSTDEETIQKDFFSLLFCSVSLAHLVIFYTYLLNSMIHNILAMKIQGISRAHADFIRKPRENTPASRGQTQVTKVADYDDAELS